MAKPFTEGELRNRSRVPFTEQEHHPWAMVLVYGGPRVMFPDAFPSPALIPDHYPELTLEQLLAKFAQVCRLNGNGLTDEEGFKLNISIYRKYRERGASLAAAWEVMFNTSVNVQFLAGASLPEGEA